MTKKDQALLSAYKNARHHSVYDLYKAPSLAKTRAEQMILAEMRENDGYDYKVIGGNSMTFSCAYKYDTSDGYCLVYHTAYNTYYVDVVECTSEDVWGQF